MVQLTSRTINDQIRTPDIDELLKCLGEWRIVNPDVVVTGINFYEEYQELDDDMIEGTISATYERSNRRTGVLVGSISYDVPVGPDNGGY